METETNIKVPVSTSKVSFFRYEMFSQVPDERLFSWDPNQALSFLTTPLAKLGQPPDLHLFRVEKWTFQA